RRDELTGTKNKTAYKELEALVQSNIENGMDYLPFALVVCDTNNLKKTNDTQGHAAGDEFVVFLRGDDYSIRQELMDKLQSQVVGNLKSGSGPILAAGISEFDPNSDSLVTEIFERADKEMYENKQKLKESGNQA
ncbi:MAG: diguanylate cyclase, partial [Butyrivibrio sp.]|nr:diguanylate cyclase [Butyrivibrio sp.]